MRNLKYYIIALIVLGCFSIQAQEQYIEPQPSDANFILARTYQESKPSSQQISLKADVVENIQYFDGLGRAFQSIGIGQSPLGADMVTPFEYDDYGRVVREWLAYPAGDDGVRGNINLGSTFAVQQYYETQYPDDFVGVPTVDVNAYAEKRFEKSPLNRLLKQAAPGKAWVIDDTNDDHAVEMTYQTNGQDEVRMFAVTTNLVNNTYEPSLVFLKDDLNADVEFYAPGELSKNITYDENHVSGKNHSIEEFTNKQGQLILKRTYADIPALDENGDTNIGPGEIPIAEEAHDIYYVYDDFGNLTYVLTPKMKPTANSLADLNSAMAELGYQYVYDHLNRLVEKKVPGKGWESIVYNDLDQPIMTQDAEQKSNDEWLFTKYDVFGRVAYTGRVSDSRNRELIQQNSVDVLTTDLWVNQGSSYAFGNIDVFYDNGAYPTQNILEILTINYYDDYSFDRENEPTPPSAVYGKTLTNKTRGLATGSKVKVLDPTLTNAQSKWITTITRYDYKGQGVYVYSENAYLGTTDVVTSKLDFLGKPLTARSAHTRNATTIVTIDNFTYDHAGRLLNQTQCIGDQTLGDLCGQVDVEINAVVNDPVVSESITATSSITIVPPGPSDSVVLQNGVFSIDPNAVSTNAAEELIAFNDYDELGLLRNKKVGGTPAATYATTAGLQTTNLKYNVRGWLKQVNDPANLGSDLFAFAMNYNAVDHNATALYNGNIAETEWKTANDNVLRWYAYEYDALNRIKAGTSYNGHYNLADVKYDRNGNIVGLKRTGVGGALIDDLQYNYHGMFKSNRLQSVSDATSNVLGFKDGGNTPVEYTYDLNGNMETDANKGITDVNYNFLNLPTRVEFNSDDISYIYDATGAKLKKVANDVGEGSLTTTEYAGNYVYEDGSLQFFGNAEGYTTPDGLGGYDYIYQYKDHLGNIRLSYTDNAGSLEIVEENNYYPFGLKHKGYNELSSALGNDVANRYKFGGKELDASLDNAWATYDFGARNYDPALGRWMNIDPMAEAMRRHSPYNYAYNNPIFFIDPDGMFPFGSGATGIYGPGDPNGNEKGVMSIAFANTKDSEKEEEDEEQNPPDDYIFDENGNYIRTELTGKPDRLVIENSQSGLREHFAFADPVNDPLSIKFGEISKIIFVSTVDIENILNDSGALDPKNKYSLSFLSEEGKGSGKLDFSYSGIPDYYQVPEVSSHPAGPRPSSVLFLPEGEKTAHNHMNFGNFLFGAAGKAMGFSSSILRAGAHYNSLKNSNSNGYDSQWDSTDDQWSIFLGARYAEKQKLGN